MPEEGKMVQCENCLIWFHEDCVDIPQKVKEERKATWNCPICSNK